MAKDFSKLDRLLQKFADTKTMPGCSCTIMQGDEIIYEGYAGYADIEAKKPITRDAIYSQASTTKLFTYAIMGMLWPIICPNGRTRGSSSSLRTAPSTPCRSISR